MTGAHRSVVHDIPVAVVPERLWPDYQEPDMPDIDVSAFSPLTLNKSWSFTLSVVCRNLPRNGENKKEKLL